MKVLMLGWEFPPFFAGGVGMVCYELTKELSKRDNVEIEFIMPYGPKKKTITNNFLITGANYSKFDKNKVKFTSVQSMIYSYDSWASYDQRIQDFKIKKTQNKLFSTEEIETCVMPKKLYGENLFEEIWLFAQRVVDLCKDKDFDVIHAHDWTTIPAAIKLSEITGKKVIFHVHITELDKTGGNGGDNRVFEIENYGFEKADSLVCVSEFTKNRLINNYGVNSNKIRVVHNGGVSDMKAERVLKNLNEKLVIFMGRLTTQKGIKFFIDAAKKVLEYEPNAKFVIAGTGDLYYPMIEYTKSLGIFDKFLFHGFYTRDDADYLFGNANVFVMPSVSEPFGIVPLEAISKGTPTIISKQSGISEVMDNCFKVDFWDIEEMANKIISILRYPALSNNLSKNCFEEYEKFSWKKPVNELIQIYGELK